jgi:membrane carboxypeptidase/penicillin-binding protein
MLQGVVARGTAAAASDLSTYIGGKTGTSEDENDAWFAGFTNDITIVVWVGYDNAGGTRRTLGGGSTGAGVALPIWESIVKAAWANGVPKTPLAPPSPEARKLIADLPIELNSGERVGRGSRSAFIEHFRLNEKGALVERQIHLATSEGGGARHPVMRAAMHAPAPKQNVVTQCFLFFCNTTAAAPRSMW